jgi:hypothetical protein
MSSPTQRSLALLRERGLTAAIVEHYNVFARVRQDLFGFVDILAIGESITLGVQTTSRSNMAARIAKISEHENWPAVLRAGWQMEVHGWAKNKSGRWEVKIFEF